MRKVRVSYNSNFDVGGSLKRVRITLPTYNDGGKTVSELWRDKTNRDWSDARKFGYSDGTYEGNIKLRQKLLEDEFVQNELNPTLSNPNNIVTPTEHGYIVSNPNEQISNQPTIIDNEDKSKYNSIYKVNNKNFLSDDDLDRLYVPEAPIGFEDAEHLFYNEDDYTSITPRVPNEIMGFDNNQFEIGNTPTEVRFGNQNIYEDEDGILQYPGVEVVGRRPTDPKIDFRNRKEETKDNRAKEYSEEFKNNVNNFLNRVNYTTPYYDDGTINTKDGGMNCINGVCQIVEGATGKKFNQQYIGNQTFEDNMFNEGYIDVNHKDEGVEVGDLIRYQTSKGYAKRVGRFDGRVGKDNKDDMFTVHSSIIVDKEVNDKGQVIYSIANNEGGDKVKIRKIREDKLFKTIESGEGLSGYYKGAKVTRYSPDRAESLLNDRRIAINILKGDNSFSNEYNPQGLKFSNDEYKDILSNSKNEKEYNTKLEVMKGIEDSYKLLGKGSNMPQSSFYKLLAMQTGIMGQESNYGFDEGFKIKEAIPDKIFNGIKDSKLLRKLFGRGGGSGWIQELWNNMDDNERGQFSNKEEFEEMFKTSDGSSSGVKYNRSKGAFQQKDLSRRGRFHNLESGSDNISDQLINSMSLAIDNYNTVREKFPGLSEENLIALTILMHSAPSKALNEVFVSKFGLEGDIDYTNKVVDKSNMLYRNLQTNPQLNRLKRRSKSIYDSWMNPTSSHTFH